MRCGNRPASVVDAAQWAHYRGRLADIARQAAG
jgi:hypothetical protein